LDVTFCFNKLFIGTSAPWNRPISSAIITVFFLETVMAFPIKVCIVCSEEFELKPDKPGFANRCPECSAAEADQAPAKRPGDAFSRKNDSEVNEARREAMRNLLYRKDS